MVARKVEDLARTGAGAAGTSNFLDALRRSNLVTSRELDSWLANAGQNGAERAPDAELAQCMVRTHFLTAFQAKQLLAGRYRNFLIQSKYKVLDVLGAGGAGGVFLCEHVGMKRRVAVKMIPPGRLNDELLRRFQREAAMGSLLHPNLVHALDCDHDGGLYFLVMENVDGVDLMRLVSKHGPLSFAQVVNFGAQAAAGLQYAYQAGWIHRDVKPSNLLLDRSGRIRVTDMGVARLTLDSNDELTRQVEERAGEQTVLGSIDFMSPEQAYDSHEVDVRTDVYGLGATLYFLLTGRPPLDPGTLPEKMLQLQRRTSMRARAFRPDLPAELEQVLTKMMVRRPEGRYGTPGEAGEALRGCGCWSESVPVPALGPAREHRLYEFASGKAVEKAVPPPARKERVTPPTDETPAPPDETSAPPDETPLSRPPRRLLWALLAAVVFGLLAYAATHRWLTG